MCELVQQIEQFPRYYYLVSDIEILKKFFEETDTKYEEIHSDKNTSMVFDNKIKVILPNIVKSQQATFSFIQSKYMTVKFNFSNYLTQKTKYELKDNFQEIQFPVSAQYQFSQELKRYQAQLEKKNGTIFSILNLVAKDTIEPQLKITDHQLIIEFQLGLERFMTIVNEQYIDKMYSAKDEKTTLLYHKAPYVPIYQKDEKKEIIAFTEQVGDYQVHRTNTDKSNLTKLNLQFQCLNKLNEKTKTPTPLSQLQGEERKNMLLRYELFAIKESYRILQQFGQGIKWFNDLQKMSQEFQDSFYEKQLPELNRQNQQSIEFIHNIVYNINQEKTQYNFVNEKYYKITDQKLKNLCQYIMNNLLPSSELRSQHSVLIDLCEDDKHNKQYSLQTYQKYLGEENEFQTQIVSFAQLINMFTIYYSDHEYEFIVTPQFRFGLRQPAYPQLSQKTGQIARVKTTTMQIETRLIVKQLLTQPKSLSNDDDEFKCDEYMNLEQLQKQFEDFDE